MGGRRPCSSLAVIRYRLPPRLLSHREHPGTCGCRLKPSNLGADSSQSSRSAASRKWLLVFRDIHKLPNALPRGWGERLSRATDVGLGWYVV